MYDTHGSSDIRMETQGSRGFLRVIENYHLQLMIANCIMRTTINWKQTLNNCTLGFILFIVFGSCIIHFYPTLTIDKWTIPF